MSSDKVATHAADHRVSGDKQGLLVFSVQCAATLLHAGDLLGLRVLNNRCETFSRFIGKVGPLAGADGVR